MLGWLRLLARSFAALRSYGLRALLTHWRVEPLRCCTECRAARLPGEESRPLLIPRNQSLRGRSQCLDIR